MRMKRFLISLLVLASAVVVLQQARGRTLGSSYHLQSQVTEKKFDGPIVLQTFYYANPGKSEEVLAQRQKISLILEKIGLPAGRVMRRSGGSDDEPDVMWECEFPNSTAVDQFLKAAPAYSEFEQARAVMRSLLRKGVELRKWEVTEVPKLVR